jgi:hypothetical protein
MRRVQLTVAYDGARFHGFAENDGVEEDPDLACLVQVAEMLVAAGADPCARSTQARTSGLRPSKIAADQGRTRVAASLANLEKGRAER